MSNCDLCNLEITSDWRKFTSSQMATAVNAGLRPPDDVIDAMRAGYGLSLDDARAQWFQKVYSPGEWSVCLGCAQRIGSFLIQSPPKGYSTSPGLPNQPPPQGYSTSPVLPNQPPPQGYPSQPGMPNQSPPYGYAQPGSYSPPAPPPQASPYSIAPSYGAPYESYYPAPKTDGFAIAALVLGLIPCTCIPSILAVIFGHISLSRINSAPELYSGRTMAMWGTGLGYFFIVCNLIYGIIVASNSSRF
ncbi:MAG TPA: DUF4190 domain-containing protein [Blastocatellia bacterium]|nr:DUF4190 domain-containing protein [Blastocatellia bacterium]